MRSAVLAAHLFGRYGGFELLNLEIARALQQAGVQVRALSALTAGRGDVDGIPTCGVLPANPLLKRACARVWRARLAAHLRRLDPAPDLAIAGHVLVLPQVARYAAARGIPCWLVVAGIDIWGEWPGPVRQAIERCQYIVAISSYTADSVRRRLGAQGERVRIIHPAVDTARFRPAACPETRASDSPGVLLTVGRLAANERYKGHDLVIRALPDVIRAIGRPVHYWIAGDGDDRPRLERLSAECGVEKAVHFWGAVSEEVKLNLYQRCDVFCMPSYVRRKEDGTWAGEGFGIVYIEAGACGKPAIACDVGGQTDAVSDGVTGLLVPPDAAAVADAAAALLGDPGRTAQMGSAARRFAEERFSRERFQAQWRDLVAGSG